MEAIASRLEAVASSNKKLLVDTTGVIQHVIAGEPAVENSPFFHPGTFGMPNYSGGTWITCRSPFWENWFPHSRSDGQFGFLEISGSQTLRWCRGTTTCLGLPSFCPSVGVVEEGSMLAYHFVRTTSRSAHFGATENILASPSKTGRLTDP